MKNSITRVNMNDIFDNKDKYSSLFSEGNDMLKEILLLLWDEGLHTRGCCAGHYDEEPGTPYVGISLNNNLDKIINILSNISKEDIRISFVSRGSSKGIGIYNRELENKDNIKLFTDVFNSIKIVENKNNDDFVKVINYILSSGDYYVNIHFCFNNLKRNVYFVTDSLDIIDKLKEQYEFEIINEKFHCYKFVINKEY